MTNRRFWQRLALFLAGCALFGCWTAHLSHSSSTATNDDDDDASGAHQQQSTAVNASSIPPRGRMRAPLGPTTKRGQESDDGAGWNSRVYADKLPRHEDLARHVSSLSRRSSSSSTRRTSIVESSSVDDDDVVVRVIVGYRNAHGLSKLLLRQGQLDGMMLGTAAATPASSSLSTPPPLLSGLSRVHALASAFRFGDLRLLADDPDVAYVDVDSIVSGADTNGAAPRDAIPVGMYQVQNGPRSAIRRQYSGAADQQPQPQPQQQQSPSTTTTGPCLDEKALRVAIVDSGVDARHPDLPCHLPHACVGRDFTGSGAWDAPDNDHGTHVMGTLAALPNGIGVLGMVPDPASVCWIVAKVLDGDNQGLMSHVLEGAEWAAFQQRAHVVNLSIAGGSYMNSAADLFREIRSRGSLVVAAAGNDGDSAYSYPASYDSVISVGSVGEDGIYADYSVRNSKVDLVAPGTNVFSTVRVDSAENNVMASITIRSIDGEEVTVPGMLTCHSQVAPPSSSLAGPLVECHLPSCPGSPGGHVCLFERGHALYSTVAKWCQDSGGAAAVIYHGEKNGHFNGNLSPTSPVTIPVLATTRSDGKLLLQRSALGSAVTIQAQVGYSVMSGTSMSCPVASGAMAALWQACPRCDAGALERCAFVTAIDLGTPGHDELYGYGKVQTSGALSCLQRTCC